MTDRPHSGDAGGPSHRSIEAGVAGLMIVFALIAIAGSLKVGIGWAFDGPQAGFFPFYCGLFILTASGVNLFKAFSAGGRAGLFAEWGQIGRVLSVFIPSMIFVVLVPWIGMYVSSMLLIGYFMRWLGEYSWRMVLAIALPVPLVVFVVFERWFLVPLPKGPIEEFLGF